jgi:hypothetical protein
VPNPSYTAISKYATVMSSRYPTDVLAFGGLSSQPHGVRGAGAGAGDGGAGVGQVPGAGEASSSFCAL